MKPGEVVEQAVHLLRSAGLVDKDDALILNITKVTPAGDTTEVDGAVFCSFGHTRTEDRDKIALLTIRAIANACIKDAIAQGEYTTHE